MKNTRKILALVLVLMMVLPMFTMFTVSAASTTVRVYLDNKANWTGTLNCYCWSNASGAPTNGAKTWPGNAMTKDTETGFYYYDIPAGNDMCIFNNGSSQTANLKVPEAASTQIKFNNKDNIWGSLKATCTTHTPGPAATCTDPQLCTVCNDPIKAALGHNYSGAICTRCNAVATYRLVGDEKLCNGVSWDTGADVNKMAYDAETGIYSITINSSKLATGSYKYKVARDGSWGPGEYPASGDSVLNYTAGSDVIVFTWNPAKQELKATPHAHSFVEGKCSCGAEDPTYVPPHTHNFVAGEIVAPTFDAEGYTTYTCSCGGSEKRDIVPALVAVAQVGDVKYADIQEAIKAAAPAGTVELLCDVTVEEWIMISEILTIGDGTVITLDMNGLTIDGNGHTLTINDVESAGNGGHIFFDGDYNVSDLTLVMGDNVNGLGITSGTITNVTFIGVSAASAGAAIHVSDGIVTGVHAGNVTIEGCTFKNNGGAIYFETAQDNLVVNNNTFEIAAGANVIMFRGTEQFTNNTVVSGRTVNVVSGSPVITGNDFGDVRLKVYNEAAATITNNTINNLVFNDESATKTVFGGNTLSEAAAAALAAVEHEEPAHEHAWSDATCTEGQKCECGETQGEALGHDFVEGVCSRCEAADPDYAPEQPPVEEPAPQGIFDMILAWIMSFIEMILGWFKF